MRSVALLVVLLALVMTTAEASAGGVVDTIGAKPQVGVSESVSGSGVSVALGVLEGVVRVGSDPLVGCVVRGPVSGGVVRELVRKGSRHWSSGVIVDEVQEYGLISCPGPVFDGSSVVVWPILGVPPVLVGEALVAAAVASVEVGVPVPRSSPDGVGVPFLVGLPVWLWVEESVWVPVSGSVSLPELGLSVTATLSPVSSVWGLGDGSGPLVCVGGGVSWLVGVDEDGACLYEYRVVGEGLVLSVGVEFGVSVSCVPVGLCVGVDVPGSVVVSASREVGVTEVRGVLTG